MCEEVENQLDDANEKKRVASGIERELLPLASIYTSASASKQMDYTFSGCG